MKNAAPQLRNAAQRFAIRPAYFFADFFAGFFAGAGFAATFAAVDFFAVVFFVMACVSFFVCPSNRPHTGTRQTGNYHAAAASGFPCAATCAPLFSNMGTHSTAAASGLRSAAPCKWRNRAARSSAVSSSARAQTERNRADIPPPASVSPSVTLGNAATAETSAPSDSWK